MYQKKSYGIQKEGNRPRISPEKEPLDMILEVASLLGVVAMVVITAVNFHGLPDQVPTHFNASGLPNDYSSKGMIWLLPGIAVIMFAGLVQLNRFPYIFNFPVNITEENAERLYRHACRSMRILNLLLVIMFLYLTWQSIAVAKGQSPGIGIWFVPVNAIVILIFTIYMIVRMYRLK